MTSDDLTYDTVDYMGDSADFFDIPNNSNYSGYTRDHLIFHVLNHTTNGYTSYTKSQFDNFLSSLSTGNGYQNISVSTPKKLFTINKTPVTYTPNSDLMKYFILGLAGVAAFIILT